MDAFLQKIASSMLFTSAKSAPAQNTKQQKPVLLASGSPRSHPIRHSAPRMQQPEEQPRELPRRRIAHWDKKREKCANCQHIYLKTLSQHPGFCSVDCKSNMAYLEKVNRTIRAMKDAVAETECKTFAEFGLEYRILEASNVEWAFSAMY
ncbi:uncharacterized protein PITG_00436 [Phytophthora infestans T30-4]|uniref:FLZ-type domain-containing protein n=1 Tax=Phytophthora infestans (strain T30-4) TaxID=403677 RepID=D0MQT0_PHYIT|nr:uncharacterized protein PITG_00436 [Phytophthora infestans T30-4]EEY57849.1 conserved hypothetical protein [Phytophthora infestans T30-4]|eukprot:XP_002909035.1 conserved hypothetical protein [Phytophthora infestans T30-4]